MTMMMIEKDVRRDDEGITGVQDELMGVRTKKSEKTR